MGCWVSQVCGIGTGRGVIPVCGYSVDCGLGVGGIAFVVFKASDPLSPCSYCTTLNLLKKSAIYIYI